MADEVQKATPEQQEAEAHEERTVWPPSPLDVPPYKLVSVGREQKPKKPSGLHPKAKDQPVTGEQIREARKRLGWTQAQLAERVGLSRPFIALVEQGRRILSPEDLERVRRALGI